MKILTSHGNVSLRRAALCILETGLEAADPYNNAKKMIRFKRGKMVVGNSDFEPRGTPKTGDEIYDLSKVGNIYIFGAGKGCQRVAKAFEDSLGDKLTGGHVIDKKDHPIILRKIGVTLGGHPLPDEDCVKGCERILEMTKGLRKEDLVFTIVTNGVSSLLTLPVPGVSIEDVRNITYMMQIERGASTQDLNPIRNHVDMMKGGRISNYIHPAHMIHVIAVDPGKYDQLMNRNNWIATLPDYTTFKDAVLLLRKWKLWDVVSPSVKKYLETADPFYETIKAKEFKKMHYRIFGVMPNRMGMVPTAKKKARKMGFRPIIMAESLNAEANPAGLVVATIARTIERTGQPVKPPCALFTSGELRVTVGKEKGVGGRNQEFVLSAAIRIAGSKNIVIAAVDSDGTDGPGTQFVKTYEDIPCLAGGIVDGETFKEAEEAAINIQEELRKHNATLALWKLQSGIVATNGISLDDISVILIGDDRKVNAEE